MNFSGPLKEYLHLNLEQLKENRVLTFCSVAQEAFLKGGKIDTILFTGEKFRMRPLIGRTIFFTSDYENIV